MAPFKENKGKTAFPNRDKLELPMINRIELGEEPEEEGMEIEDDEEDRLVLDVPPPSPSPNPPDYVSSLSSKLAAF